MFKIPIKQQKKDTEDRAQRNVTTAGEQMESWLGLVAESSVGNPLWPQWIFVWKHVRKAPFNVYWGIDNG